MTTAGEKINEKRLLSFLLRLAIFFVFQETTIPSTSAVTTQTPMKTSRICIDYNSNNKVKVRHKSCLLRPDTGPCRADILQYYFDARLSKCFRFFWGGCQGNGNKFNTYTECINHCYLEKGFQVPIPNFCSLPFDYGTCFGHFNRWYWDRFYKVCKPRLYSGCGGNQNNFHTKDQCLDACLISPKSELKTSSKNRTTCIALD